MYSQRYSHVLMWELDHKEGWASNNWYFWIGMLAKTLGSLLSCKIKPVNPKENQPWIFIGRTDAEAEVPVLWPPDVKNWLTGKDPDARKDWRQEEKGMTEDKMVVWHHQLKGHESEQALGADDGQGSREYCSPRGHKESGMTERLNWMNLGEVYTDFHIRWPKYWSFSFSISPPNEYSGLNSFRMYCLGLLVVQGTLKSLIQHHSSKASILWCSALFIVQLSQPYMTCQC